MTPQAAGTITGLITLALLALAISLLTGCVSTYPQQYPSYQYQHTMNNNPANYNDLVLRLP